MNKEIQIIIKQEAKRNFLLAFCLSFLVIGVQAQINHVVNGGFDTVGNCLDPYPGYIIFVQPWDTLINGGGDGENMNRCYPRPTNYGIPYNLNGGGYQEPRNGEGYAYLIYYKLTPNPSVNWRGYVQQKMRDTLKSGKSYCVTYWANLVNYSTYAVDELGAYFDDGSIQSIAPLKEAPANPQVKSPGGVFYMDTLNWMKVQGTFTANGTESYITLGNFRLNSATTYTSLDGNSYGRSLYFIDDVSVIETDLPAYAGPDKYVIPGDSVFIGRTSEIGLDDDCFWYTLPGNMPVDTVAGLYVKPAVTSTYVVKQDICGVIKYDTVIVHASGVGLTTLYQDAISFQLIPNPAGNYFYLNLSASNNTLLNLSISNSFGQIIREEILKLKDSQTLIETQDLTPGIYLVTLNNSNGERAVKKLVISK